jgi:hypothetical protein
VPEVDALEVAGVGEGTSILSGDLVRDLVARNEDVIEALETRLAEIERLAAEAERAVRAHPALAKVDPEVARGMIPDPPVPVVIDDGRPRTTVVQRPRYPAPGPVATSTPTRGVVGAPRVEEPPGVVGRLVQSHWWWRIGIALVAAALVILKVG